MQLTHKIKLNPTLEQREYFQKAAGTGRFVWNWALAKWKEQYTAGQRPIVADRFYPSSKLCSFCDLKNELLTLKDREWTCQSCGAFHDRDQNAAMNLKRLATKTALPVASQSVTNGTEIDVVSISGG